YRFITGVDSMNVRMSQWTALVNTIADLQNAGFDAVIVAHGTDTMAYTASALAYGLHGLNSKKSGLRIPVILTGAQLPMMAFANDGQLNLMRSLVVATSCSDGGVADVLVVFGTSILLGCRAMKRSDRQFESFHSPTAVGNVGEITALGV